MSPDPLGEVRRAVAGKRRAEDRYRAALAAAVEQGFSFAEVGRAAGISRQGVRKLTRFGVRPAC